MKYRLYIDEVGNHDLKNSDSFNNRFLSLTGVLMELEYVKNTVHPQLEKLKTDYFNHHPDTPVVLHRKELIFGHFPFDSLRNEQKRDAFNTELLAFLDNWKYRVFSVCIDKKRHRDGYKTWTHHPYHYCLEVLVEKTVLYLNRFGKKCDVMIEARAKQADRLLKNYYKKIYEKGTDYATSAQCQSVLTSRELKIKPKIMNIAGLQVADLIAHPSRNEILFENNVINDDDNLIQIAPFGREICRILQSKYDQYNGNFYGKKFIQK